MFHLKALVVKGSAVDRFTTSSIKVDEISSLYHEVFNNSVKQRSLEVQRFSGRFSDSSFAGDKLPKVFGRFRDNIAVEFDNDASKSDVSNRNVEKDPRPVCFGHD